MVILAHKAEWKDQTAVDDMDNFWKGLLLSFGETTARRFKKKKEEINHGITTGVALQTRAYVIYQYSENVLDKRHEWFNNDPSPPGDRNPRVNYFYDICVKTWTFGADMAIAIKSMYTVYIRGRTICDFTYAEVKKQLEYSLKTVQMVSK